MTTNNPRNPDEENWMKPNVHPSKRAYSQIPKSEWEDDYIDLLNSVQRHTQRSSAYCLSQSNGKQSCRFEYPFDKCKETHLQFEKMHTKDGSERYKVKVVTSRNDIRLNKHQRFQLQGWRANCDINIIIDYHSCVEYLTKYASKSERLSAVVRDAFVSVINEASDTVDVHRRIKKMIMKAVGQHNMSIQEVMHQILSIKLFSSSCQVIAVSFEGSRRVEKQNNEIVTEPSLLDAFANREQFKEQCPDISSYDFIQFVSNYFVKNKKLDKRKNEVIVRTFPTFSFNPKGPHYGSFCKYQLLRYKPWTGNVENAWNKNLI